MKVKDAQRLAKMAIARAKERVGERGWRLMSFEYRQAFISQEIIGIILGWHGSEETAASVFAVETMKLAATTEQP